VLFRASSPDIGGGSRRQIEALGASASSPRAATPKRLTTVSYVLPMKSADAERAPVRQLPMLHPYAGLGPAGSHSAMSSARKPIFIPQVLNYHRLTGSAPNGWMPFIREVDVKKHMAAMNADLRDAAREVGATYPWRGAG
jgi:hypothetical protein